MFRRFYNFYRPAERMPEPERDPEHQKNANYCSYCGAKIVERENYEKIK